jgi:hypothetical protein
MMSKDKGRFKTFYETIKYKCDEVEFRTVHATLLDRNIHLHIWTMHRKFLERMHLPAAGIKINRSSPLHVLKLRYPDCILRQYTDFKLFVA